MLAALLLITAFWLSPSPIIETKVPFGLSLNVSVNGGAEEYVRNLTWLKDHQLKLTPVSVKWPEVEQPAGLAKFSSDIKGFAAFGFTPIVTI